MSDMTPKQQLKLYEKNKMKAFDITFMNGWYYLNYSLGDYIIFIMNNSPKKLFDVLVNRLVEYYSLGIKVNRESNNCT